MQEYSKVTSRKLKENCTKSTYIAENLPKVMKNFRIKFEGDKVFNYSTA